MARVTASLISIGNELLAGDTINTNAAWLAQELEELGVSVTLMASLPDEVERIAEFVRTEAQRAEYVIVTGGLGGTPDDVTREAWRPPSKRRRTRSSISPSACARDFPPTRSTRLAGPTCRRVRARSRTRSAARPGFVVHNVYVLPGLPAEMKAMFQ